MKKTHILLLTLVILLLPSAISSQPWLQGHYLEFGNMQDFQKMQKSFDEYWENKEMEKGKGWKPFKRWEYFMEQRIYPDGVFPANAMWKEYQKIKSTSTRDTITAQWELYGPVETPLLITTGGRRGSGRVNTVAFHPTDPNIIYVGTPAGGFWKSPDNGASWFTTTDDLLSLGVSDIAVHPHNPDTIYIATGDGDAMDTYSIGVLKSIDGGLNWETTGLSFVTSSTIVTRRLLINPDNPDIILVTTSDGIYKTEDAGETWTKRVHGNFKDMEFKPGDPNIVYATRFAYSGGATIYKSTNAGTTFTMLLSTGITPSQVERIELAVTPAAPSVVYALCSKSDDSGLFGVYKSEDEASTWTKVLDGADKNLLGWSTDGSDAGGQGWFDLSLAVSPVNPNLIHTGGVNVWRSSNGGTSWNLSGHWYGGGGVDYIHADHHFFVYNPHNGYLYSGNDGGIYYTPNAGTNWVDISDGLEILQIYRCGLSADSSFFAVTGTQDNGTMKRDTSGIWNAILGGDGMECIIDYTNNRTIYAELYYGRIHKSTDGGYNFSPIYPTEAGDGNWVSPYVMDPFDNNTIYAGYKDVWKTTNGGSSWFNLSNLGLARTLTSIAVAPSNPQYMYISTGPNTYRSKNAGQTWTSINAGLPSLTLTYIAVSQYNPEKIWATFSGFSNNNKVFYSENGGTTWTNFSQGLPNIPANTIVYEHNSNEALYVGTDLGVYYRNNLMSQWVRYSDGLPNVVVNELEINYPSHTLVAATYGRGLWASPLWKPETQPIAKIGSYFSQACEGIVQFYDLSAGNPHTWLWDFGDGNTSTEKNPVHVYSSTNSHTVTLIAGNNHGSDTMQMEINFPANPIQASFSANATTFCNAPAAVSFNNTSYNATEYIWDFGDGNTANQENPTHIYSELGDYTVTLIAKANLCPADTLIRADLISIDFANPTTANLPIVGSGPTIYCCSGFLYDNGGTGFYTNNTTGRVTVNPVGADVIRITFNQFNIEAGETSACENDYLLLFDGPNILSPIIGKYCNSNPPPSEIFTSGDAFTARQVTNSSGTAPGFILKWECLTGTEDRDKNANAPMLHPNPSTGIINITMPESFRTETNISVYDLQNRILLQKTIPARALYSQLDLSDMQSGIYLVNLQNESGQWTYKQIVAD